MRFARSIGFDVAQVAGVMFGRCRSAVMLMGGIEMRPRRRCVGCRAIALFVNMKTVSAWFEILDLCHHLNIVARFCEHDDALHLTARGRLQVCDRFGQVLSLCESGERAEKR